MITEQQPKKKKKAIATAITENGANLMSNNLIAGEELSPAVLWRRCLMPGWMSAAAQNEAIFLSPTPRSGTLSESLGSPAGVGKARGI